MLVQAIPGVPPTTSTDADRFGLLRRLVADLPAGQLALALYFAPLGSGVGDLSRSQVVELGAVGAGYAGLEFVRCLNLQAARQGLPGAGRGSAVVEGCGAGWRRWR